MYEAFDAFLNTETWHSAHQLDSDRFFKSLAFVVRNENFNVEHMGEYFYEVTGVSPDDEGEQAAAIERYMDDAEAVRNYLRVIGWLE